MGKSPLLIHVATEQRDLNQILQKLRVDTSAHTRAGQAQTTQSDLYMCTFCL